MSVPLATPSLRRRLILVVLGLVAVMVLVLAIVTDRVLADRLDAQLRQRLVDRAAVAGVLVDRVEGRDLARRLEGEGVSVVLTEADGTTYAEGPLAGNGLEGLDPSDQPSEQTQAAPRPSAGPGISGSGEPDEGLVRPAPEVASAVVVQRGHTLSVVRDLVGGDKVVLLADTRDIASTMSQVRLALALAGLLVLLMAAALVPVVVRRALLPLDRITDAARSIGDGDRGLRLRPTRPETELGRTASAFDLMLDDITGAEQRATASEARLRDFLFDAAHELRTPLTGVQAAAERVLRDDPARPERERVLVMLVRESQRAGRLVEDLLLAARLDGGLRLERHPVDLGEVVAEVAAGRRLVHPSARICTDPPGPDPVIVDGDRDRLSQLVGNLVDNAVQAAGAGARVTLTAEWAEDARAVRLVVADDGPGVPVPDRERIFERLVRLDESRATRTGGVGLGLPIVRGLAHAHGGEARCVEPVEGVGARFEVLLPGSPGSGPGTGQ